MALQLIYEAPSNTAFPVFMGNQGFMTPAGSAIQLRRLFYLTPSRTLVGCFLRLPTNDYDNAFPFGSPTVGNGILSKIWLDGTLLTLAGNIPQPAFIWGYGTSMGLPVVATNDGRIARVFDRIANRWEVVIQALDGGRNFYAVDTIWPSDVLTPGALASAALADPGQAAVLLPALNQAYSIFHATSSQRVDLIVNPGTNVKFQVSYSGSLNQSWSHPRDLLFIDGSTVAVTFMQVSAGIALDATKPAIIRVFNTTGASGWHLLFEDTLPDDDDVAAFDPIHSLIWSMKKFPPSRLHASYLRRAPSTISIPTTIGTASQLRELTATDLSVIVTDGLGSMLSSVLVQWTLASTISGGKLVSNYSLTNASGIATITYTGPFLPSVAQTETICAAVTTVEEI